MKTNYVIAVVVGAMALEAVIAYAFWPTTAEIAPQETRQERRRRVKDVQETADTKALRQRITELEQRIAELTSNNDAGDAEEKVAENGEQSDRRQRENRRFGPPSFKDMRERMERMAKEDPVRYAQMTNGMAQGMRRMQERNQAKTDFLSSVDVSKMTAEQKEIHSKYLEMTARQQELQEYMRPDANVTDEERQAALEEMRAMGRETRELGRQERDVLLAQAAQNMGYSAEESEAVVSQIKEIYQVTDSWGGFGGPGGPGGGRGGRGGGRGR